MRAPAALIALILIAFARLGCAQPGEAWRYDLHRGDHLTYTYSIQRQTDSEDATVRTEARFKTHVLIANESAGHFVLGFQRNRESAELQQYSVKGKNRLVSEIPAFQKRMQARPKRFSEAMEITARGEPQYSWEMARETFSHILDALHEVLVLPPSAVQKGEAWRGNPVFGLDYRWVSDESLHAKNCHHVEASSPDHSLSLRYWWSPESGVIEKIEMDGKYSVAGGTVHEIAQMELVSSTHNEPIQDWLANVETQEGALQAALLSPAVTISAQQLAEILAAPSDPETQALALKIVLRRKISLPPDTVSKLGQTAALPRNLSAALLSNGLDSAPLLDACKHPLPPKPQAEKFGTLLDVVPPSSSEPPIPYLIRVPLTYREDHASPLLVYLSGGAGLAIDAVNSAQDVLASTDYVVLYPHAGEYWWKPEMARRFATVLQQVVTRYNIDPDRIYLTGFSNGGTGALYFASLWPHRFAAVVSLMGAGQCNEQIKAGMTNLETLPVLFVHGENDPRIPADCSRATHAALADLHPITKPEIRILPKRDHDITLQSDDGLTLKFFEGKRRSPFPRRIEINLYDDLAARSYWVEIVDGKPGKSHLEARVKSDDILEIRSRDVKKIRLYLGRELLRQPGDIQIEWNGKKLFTGPIRDFCSTSTAPPVQDPSLQQVDVREFSLPEKAPSEP